jgi:glycerol kinase
MQVVSAMHADSGVTMSVMRVDGGMTSNSLVMQLQADLLDIPLYLPEIAETTSLGAAFAAGLAVGFWQSADELKKMWMVRRSWIPHMAEKKRCLMV